jgi:hypothetical protein
MTRQKFKVKLAGRAGSEISAIKPPFDVAEVFGSRGRVPVKGTVNGAPYRSSLMNMGEGHIMVINAELRAAAKCKAGDIVEVVMERDDAERTVEVPAYLLKIIESMPRQPSSGRSSPSRTRKSTSGR